MYNVIIGIDPGLGGGIAAIKGSNLLFVDKTPVFKKGKTTKREFDLKEMSDILKKYKSKETVVYIEKVHAMPSQGVTSMFNFGKGYGFWIGICAALGLEVKYVRPQEWKKRVIPWKDKSKKASVDRTLQLFPDVNLKPGRTYKDHDGMAEAILIAVYGGLVEWC